MRAWTEKLEGVLKWGGIGKDVALLVLSGAAVVCSLLGIQPFPFDIAWVAIVLCGLPIVLEAIIGLVTALDIKADVLVSLALIASVCIGEYFAAGEVAVIMQLGALLEELTVARARGGDRKTGAPDAPDSAGFAGWEGDRGSRPGGPDRGRAAGPAGGDGTGRRADHCRPDLH